MRTLLWIKPLDSMWPKSLQWRRQAEASEKMWYWEPRSQGYNFFGFKNVSSFLGIGKGWTIESPLKPLWRNPAFPTPQFQSRMPVSEFWPPEQWYNKLIHGHLIQQVWPTNILTIIFSDIKQNEGSCCYLPGQALSMLTCLGIVVALEWPMWSLTATITILLGAEKMELRAVKGERWG